MRRFIPFLAQHPVVPVIRLHGAIGANGRGLNDAGFASLIERAFGRGKPAAVALVINSPGGSPVQSSLMAARIRRLADEKRIPVHAFVEDVAASGGYWLASAADHIWADANSIIGSIGVISAGFGFDRMMARHGIERRLHVAGRSKSFADPFRPQSAEDITRIHALLAPLHENFIAHVRARRGARLSDQADLFNADIWLGQKAVDLGLADGVAHLKPKMQEIFGPRVRLLPLARKQGVWRRLAPSLGNDLLDMIEERGLWARYGL